MKENMSNTQALAALPTVEETLAVVREVKKARAEIRTRHESGKTKLGDLKSMKYGRWNASLAMQDAFKEGGI